MTALPADISRYTSDGVLLTRTRLATKTNDPNAQDTGERELEMFFDSAAHAGIVLDELFNFVGTIGRVHEGIELEDSVGLGTTIPIVPNAPQATLVDESRRMFAGAIVRAYGFDGAVDRYAIEFVGAGSDVLGNVTYDSTVVRMDSSHTSDES
jgi:hypothetical protein